MLFSEEALPVANVEIVLQCCDRLARGDTTAVFEFIMWEDESFNPTMQLHLVHQAPCTIPHYLSKNGSSLGDLLIGFLKYATEFDWSHQIISVHEAKGIPRPDGIEWRNKFICVEEPFDGTNTARALHEKQKFDIIKDEFLKSWQILRDKKDLNCILPLRITIQKR
ncbi:poly(A) RNA polymerase GLD2-like [Morphnus guianensis]